MRRERFIHRAGVAIDSGPFCHCMQHTHACHPLPDRRTMGSLTASRGPPSVRRRSAAVGRPSNVGDSSSPIHHAFVPGSAHETYKRPCRPAASARHFRAATGTTPHRWLLEQRLQRAELLLETTDLTVDVVAQRSGFGSVDILLHHFARRRITPQRPPSRFPRLSGEVFSGHGRPTRASSGSLRPRSVSTRRIRSVALRSSRFKRRRHRVCAFRW